MVGPTIALLLLALLALPVLQGICIVPEAQRVVVLRLGRFRAILGPGLHWILPGVDRVIRVDLGRSLPDWQSLAEPELQDRLRQLAVTGQLPTNAP